MRFQEIVGLQATKENLIKMWEHGRMPHAMLLLGREGTGGLPLAIALSQFILCQNKQATDSCGQCPNCQKVQRLEHADLHLSFPTITGKTGKSAMSRDYSKEFRTFVHDTPYGSVYDWLQLIEAENKQGNLSAEECREIIDKLNLKSYEGGSKIQIVWRAEYLSKNGNIMLKLIEEPPAGTFIILVAEDVEDILPTILSRTQLIRLPPIAPSEIAAALQSRGLSTPTKALQIGQIAEGSFSEALRLVAHLENDLLPSVKALFNALFTNNGLGLVQFSEEWAKAGREGIKNILGYMLSVLEGSLRAQHIPSALSQFAPGEAEFIGKLAAKKLAASCYIDLIKAITDASYYVERNANTKSVLTAMGIKLRQAIHRGKN
ncbi:MAG: hypothetical protein ABI378_05275 [Chitinophagaceae bacterium]